MAASGGRMATSARAARSRLALTSSSRRRVTSARPAAARLAPWSGAGGILARAATKGPAHSEACLEPLVISERGDGRVAAGRVLGTTAVVGAPRRRLRACRGKSPASRTVSRGCCCRIVTPAAAGAAGGGSAAGAGTSRSAAGAASGAAASAGAVEPSGWSEATAGGSGGAGGAATAATTAAHDRGCGGGAARRARRCGCRRERYLGARCRSTRPEHDCAVVEGDVVARREAWRLPRPEVVVGVVPKECLFQMHIF
jgi:hypothetical protein